MSDETDIKYMPKHQNKRAHQKNGTQKSGRNSSHYGFIMRRHLASLEKALHTVSMHVTPQQPGPSTQGVKVAIVDEAVENTKPKNNSGGSDCEQNKSRTITANSMDTDTVKIKHEINTGIQPTTVPNTPQYTTNSDEQKPYTETVSDLADTSLYHHKHQLKSVDTNEIEHNSPNNQSNPALRINTNDNPTEENNTTKNSTLVTNSDLTDFHNFSYHTVLLNFCGLKPDTRTELKKNIISKYQLLPPLELELCVTSETLPLLSNCTGIYTSNWPTWLSLNNVRYMIKLLTDFDPYTEWCEIDVLLYKTKQHVGAALIRFTNNKDCLRVYDQMRVITVLQSRIKVELDFDGKISQQIDREAATEILEWYKPIAPKFNDRAHHGYAVLLIPAPENYQEDPNPLPNFVTSRKQNRKKKKKTTSSAMTLLETTNSAKTPQYSRMNDLIKRNELANSVPTSNDPKIIDWPETSGWKGIIEIQEFLGLNHTSFKSNKKQIRKIGIFIIPPISKLYLGKSMQCTGIFVTGFPVDFEAQHYVHILRLLMPDFNFYQRTYFIEFLKYSNNSNMGAIFMKFSCSAFCMKVYKTLCIVYNLQGHIPESRRLKVGLDVYGHSKRIGIDEDQLNELVDLNVHFTKFRMRPFVTAVLQQDCCPALHQRFAEFEIDSQTQLLDGAKPVPLEPDDDDDVVILIPQTIPEVDLTEDVDNESTEMAKNDDSNNNGMKEERIDGESNVCDKTSSLVKHDNPELEDDLGKLIDQELLHIDINKMIKEDTSEDNGNKDTDHRMMINNVEDCADSNSTVKKTANENTTTAKTGYEAGQRRSVTDCSKQNNKQNENARTEVSIKNSHVTEATNDKQSNAANISIPTPSRIESIDLINSDGEIIVSDSDNEDGTGNCKIVNVRNLPPVETCIVLKELISKHTKFDINKKFFFIKLLREGATAKEKPLGECLLKFNTHEDAVEVSRGLDRIYFKQKYIDAKLGTGHKVSNVHNSDTSTPNAQVLKRKLNSDGTHKETLASQPKRAKFDDCWDVVGIRRAYMKPDKPDMNTYGFSKDFIFKSGCRLPLSCFVVVKNLHERVNEAKLYEVFCLAGDVKQVTLSKNENEYMARIEYDHPVEAVQAVSMLHHQKLYDYKMDVSIDNTFDRKPLPVGLSGVGKGLGKDGQPVKGVRTNIELRQVHEILYEMGRMNKYENKDQPFQALYTKRTNPPPFSDTTSGVNSSNSTIKPKITQALDAFGKVLIALDAIPVGTNCSNLYNVIQALKDSGNQNKSKIRNKSKSSINSSLPKNNPHGSPPLLSEPRDVSAPSTSVPTVVAPPPDQLYSAFCNFMQNFAGNVNIPNISGNNSSSNICNTPNLYPPERQFNNHLTTQPNLGLNISQPLLNIPDVSAPLTSAPPNLNIPPPSLLELKFIKPPPCVSKQTELQKSAEHSENAERKAAEWIESPKVIRFQNLPPSVTSQPFINKMKEVGDIHCAKITEFGTGIVLFKKYQDAERCIQLFHNSKVDGHVIEVYYSMS